MVPYHITIKMVLSLKIFKSSKMYNHKSVRALFSAPNHFLHLFFLVVPIWRKKDKKIKGCLHTHYLASVYYSFAQQCKLTHCSLLAGKVIDRTIEYYVKSARLEKYMGTK